MKINYTRTGKYFIISEILQQRGSSRVADKNSKHLLSGFRKKLLSISRIRHRLTFLSITAELKVRIKGEKNLNRVRGLLETDVPKVSIGNIPDENPSHFEDAFPFIWGPNSATASIIDWSKHFGHTTEMTAMKYINKWRRNTVDMGSPGVNAEEEVYRSTTVTFFERLV